MDKATMHKEICDNLHDIYIRKNADYGDSFGKSFDKYGITACMVRMEDKWNRLNNLVNGKRQSKIKDESIEDTMLDLANYLILTYMELKCEKEKLCDTQNSPLKINVESVRDVEQNCSIKVRTERSDD